MIEELEGAGAFMSTLLGGEGTRVSLNIVVEDEQALGQGLLAGGSEEEGAGARSSWCSLLPFGGRGRALSWLRF